MPASVTVLVNPPNPAGYGSNKDSMGGLGQLYQILQRDFINRRGFLKNEHRDDLPYRVLRRAADLAFGLAGLGFFRLGSLWLRLRMRTAPRGPATIVGRPVTLRSSPARP